METTAKKTNKEIISEARAAFKGQWGNVIVAFILSSLVGAAIYGAVFLLIGVITTILNIVFSSIIVGIMTLLLGIMGVIIALIFQGRIWNWQNNYILRRSRGEQVSNTDFKEIFEGISGVQDIKPFLLDKNNLIKNLYPAITQLISTLAILIGFVLLVIPGIILSYMYAMVPFLSSENKTLAPVDVLKKSSSIMDGYKMKLFFCYLSLLPLAILCILPLGLGLIWFIPFLTFVLAKFYDAHK